MRILPSVSSTRRPTNASRRALRGAHCRCSSCELEFNSLSAFDRHRTGEGIARRCLTTSEMIALGMCLNRGGWWVSRMGIPAGLSFAGAAIVVGALLSPGGGDAKPARARRELAEEVSP